MNYKILKNLTVALQTLNVPIGVYSGIMLATGKPFWFTIGISTGMLMAFIQGHIWWKTMEKIND